ncbi:MAG TPA: alpha/beta hydrolase [Myxococcales bacterium]|nr:alpha/beta hydrolase [Myxococcales bacterium]
MTVPVRVGTAEAPDGAVLWWRADGAGPPLLCSNGIGLSTFFWRKLTEYFAATHTVVTWDYRGHGRSPVPEHPEGVTVAQCARDLWTVAERAGVGEAVLLGHSMGVQVSLEAYRLRPDRVRAFVPMLGAPGAIFASFTGGRAMTPVLTFLLEIASRNAALAQKALRTAAKLPGVRQAARTLRVVDPERYAGEDFEQFFEHLAGLDLRACLALARDLFSHDASPMLADVNVPTLVIAGERDRFLPVARSRELASLIPGAELLVVRGGSHAALVEQPELIALAVEKFLRQNGIA